MDLKLVARLCGDCGHLHLDARPEALELLRGAWAELAGEGEGRCPGCGGSPLSPASVVGGGGVLCVAPLLQEPGGLFRLDAVRVESCGRVCRDCGLVTLFATEQARHLLSERWSALRHEAQGAGQQSAASGRPERCTACGSGRISSEGEVRGSSDYVVDMPAVGKGFLARFFGVSFYVHLRGWVCGDCGQIMLAPTEQGMSRLIGRWAELRW